MITMRAEPAMDGPLLSVILPCYRSAPLARDSAHALAAFLDGTGYAFEIVVVDDGGGDFAGIAWADARIRLVTLPQNRGKGAAVRAGMLAARGAVRCFTDVDVPYDPALLPVMAEYIQRYGYHVVVGDRTLPESRYALDVGWRRRIASGVFSTFVGTLVTGGFFDTQCGLKAVRGDVAEELFRLTRIDRFAFDVELLYLALSHRLDIKRIPVQLRVNETSSVRLVRDSTRMIVDVLRIKANQLRGYYRSAALSRMVSEDFRRVQESITPAHEPTVRHGTGG